MFYLGIQGRLDDLAHHTIYLSDDYRKTLQDVEEGRVPPGEPCFYLQNACVSDPASGPSRTFDAVCAGAGGPRA